jgi:hypothetical protein
VNVDDFMFKRFVEDEYTCMEFTRDVWLACTGEDLRQRLGSLLQARTQRLLRPTLHHSFKRLPGPVDPCLVLMTQMGRDPHVGVFVQGSLLHLNRTGPEYLPIEIAGRGFTLFRYYQ